MDEEWAGRNGRGEEDLANAADAHEEEEEAWEDWQAGEGEDEDATQSLFDDTVLPFVEAALEYDARTHGFDLPRLRSEVTCASCFIQCARAAVLHTTALLQDVTDCRVGRRRLPQCVQRWRRGACGSTTLSPASTSYARRWPPGATRGRRWRAPGGTRLCPGRGSAI